MSLPPHTGSWRTLCLALAVAVLSLSLAACGAGSSTTQSGSAAQQAASEGPIQEGGTLIAARPADANTWDPAKVTENNSYWAMNQIFGELVRVAPDGKTFEPYIAKSWTISSNGRVFTFHLYPNAKFCDGTPITSADIKYTLMRSEKAPGTSWMFQSGTTVATPSPTTVVITLPAAQASFLSYTTLWGMHILSKNYAQKVGEAALSTKPLGSGPFCLAAWHRGVEIDLARNKYFWLRDSHGNPLPYLNAVRWMIIKDDQARAVALQSGQVQLDTAVSPAQVADLRGASSVQTDTSPLLGTIDVLLNHRFAPFQDQRVRQALNYAVDRNAIVKAVFFGYARPALSPLYLANYTTEQYGYGFDLAKARQLMAASHFPHGFTASVTYQGGDATGEATLTILKAEWAQIGVKLQLTPVEQGVLLSTQSSEKWQMFYQEGTNDVFDPAENLPYLYGGKAGGSDSAYTHYFNPTLWRLIQQASAEFSSDKRAALYNEIQKISMGDAPNVLLVHPDNIWAVRDNVHGFVVYKTGLHPFMTTWISK